jgi:hypothetical protein
MRFLLPKAKADPAKTDPKTGEPKRPADNLLPAAKAPAPEKPKARKPRAAKPQPVAESAKSSRPKAARTIDDHKVNPANDDIRVEVMDKPGPGGANHEYDVVLPNGRVTRISFQNGPIGDAGVNGLTHEVLLAIVADRLRAFQAGPFANSDNVDALNHVQMAQDALLRRTRERMARGVEGTMAA